MRAHVCSRTHRSYAHAWWFAFGSAVALQIYGVPLSREFSLGCSLGRRSCAAARVFGSWCNFFSLARMVLGLLAALRVLPLPAFPDDFSAWRPNLSWNLLVSIFAGLWANTGELI